jgi:acetyl esterase/lipase
MSLKYELIKFTARVAGLKKWGNKSTDELIKYMKENNAKNTIPELKDNEFDIDRIEIMGCLVIRMIHKNKTEKANLFLIGGGMVRPPRPKSIKKALEIARESGVDLYIPYYPLCTDYPISKAYEMVFETYKKMLGNYEAKNISFLGTSSGGSLALGLIAYINNGHDAPMPNHIIAISPGTCVVTDEEWKRMQDLDKKDLMVSANYMKNAAEILKHGDATVPDYMIYTQTADFTGCPKVTFMYGTDETLYAVAPSFENAMKKYSVDYDMIIGEGLFHCYPVFPIVKEAEEGYNQMIELLKA